MGAKLGHNGLSIKENKFVIDYVKTGNATQAVENNYDVKNRKNANKLSTDIKKKPRIQEAIRLEMQKQGLSPEVVVNALKTNILTGQGVKSTAETANRGIDIYAKITGLYDREDIEQSYKLTLSKLNSKELRIELEKLTKSSTALINDLAT